MRGKTILLALIPCVLLCLEPLWAQSEDSASDSSENDAGNDIEELIVRGRRLSDFRVALEAARVRVYDVFNDLNSDDAFDVHCLKEASTGTRMRQHICRPRFRNDISSAAAKAWVNSLQSVCPEGMTQECIFSERAAQAMSAAQGVESTEGSMQQLFTREFARVVLESSELQQAILDYEALERAYDEARRGRRGR